jgi:hypothetical protein
VSKRKKRRKVSKTKKTQKTPFNTFETYNKSRIPLPSLFVFTGFLTSLFEPFPNPLSFLIYIKKSYLVFERKKRRKVSKTKKQKANLSTHLRLITNQG